MIFYNTYTQFLEDIKYWEKFIQDNGGFRRRRYDEDHIYFKILDGKVLDEIKTEWFNHMREKYESTKKSNSHLGKFLKMYPINFKEFCCLMDLIKN